MKLESAVKRCKLVLMVMPSAVLWLWAVLTLLWRSSDNVFQEGILRGHEASPTSCHFWCCCCRRILSLDFFLAAILLDNWGDPHQGESQREIPRELTMRALALGRPRLSKGLSKPSQHLMLRNPTFYTQHMTFWPESFNWPRIRIGKQRYNHKLNCQGQLITFRLSNDESKKWNESGLDLVWICTIHEQKFLQRYEQKKLSGKFHPPQSSRLPIILRSHAPHWTNLTF